MCVVARMLTLHTRQLTQTSVSAHVCARFSRVTLAAPTEENPPSINQHHGHRGTLDLVQRRVPPYARLWSCDRQKQYGDKIYDDDDDGGDRKKRFYKEMSNWMFAKHGPSLIAVLPYSV